MKLYEVPEGSKIRVVANEADREGPPLHRDFNENEVLRFSRIDGMYSLCYDKDKMPVHLKAWAEVEIVNDT